MTRRNSNGESLPPAVHDPRSYDERQIHGPLLSEIADPKPMNGAQTFTGDLFTDVTGATHHVVEHEGFAVMMADGSMLLEDGTWATANDAGWLAERPVAVYRCYVEAMRRARWWAPDAFVVPCR